MLNSSSVVPSKRFGLVVGLEDLRLLLIVGVDGGWGDDEDEGIGDVVLVIIVEIDGRDDEDDGDGDTTFIIGEIIVFKEREVVSWDFCSLSIVEIVSRLSDSRNFDRNTSATSSEPRVLFNALKKRRKSIGIYIYEDCTYSRSPPDSKFFLNVCINTLLTLSKASSNNSFVWLKTKIRISIIFKSNTSTNVSAAVDNTVGVGVTFIGTWLKTPPIIKSIKSS